MDKPSDIKADVICSLVRENLSTPREGGILGNRTLRNLLIHLLEAHVDENMKDGVFVGNPDYLELLNQCYSQRAPVSLSPSSSIHELTSKQKEMINKYGAAVVTPQYC